MSSGYCKGKLTKFPISCATYLYSNRPFAIAAFFGPQQLLQLAWLRELWRKDSEVESSTLSLVPFYALGNVMIGTWLPFCTSCLEENLTTEAEEDMTTQGMPRNSRPLTSSSR